MNIITFSPFYVFIILCMFQCTNLSAMAEDSKSISRDIPQAGKHDDGNLTALQKHVKFFDRNKDGVIYIPETFEGFRAIGCGVALSSSASVFIHTGLSSKTRPGEGFDPKFPIVVKNIQMAKHGSDTDVYDEQGRFVQSKFEEIFQKHAHTHPNALTSDELSEMLKANREPNDNKGWIAASSEWKILYLLGKDDQGLLQKDTVKAVYDGSLFERMEKQRKSNKNMVEFSESNEFQNI